MKTTLIHLHLICLLMLTTTTYSQQNLVPNPSFEVYDTCPISNGLPNLTPPWYWPTTNGSPDYFNACAPFSSGVNVPDNSNYEGYQNAKTGVAYYGFGVCYSGSDYREYIQAPLLSTLIANKTYCVEFYLSLADSAQDAITEIGAYFSNTAIIYMNYGNHLPFQPQVYSPSDVFLSDKNNWMLVSGSFVSSGGESYITIGNFKDSANTDTLTTPYGQWGNSYYYIDDIFVYECADSNSGLLDIPNIFTPNGDSNNDQFLIQDKNRQIKTISIYDRWGIKVFETNNINEAWDGRTTSGMPCTDGIYYYILKLNNNAKKNMRTKGFIQLVR